LRRILRQALRAPASRPSLASAWFADAQRTIFVPTPTPRRAVNEQPGRKTAPAKDLRTTAWVKNALGRPVS
jgi:hypothetical protein